MVLWLLPLILGYGENPLPEMTSLAEAHGIRLFSLPTVGRDVDAFSFMFDGVPYVAVDTSKTAERVRFSCARCLAQMWSARRRARSQCVDCMVSPSRDMSR